MYQLSPQEIASSLPKGKCVGTNKYTACCPAHGDSSPSLHISLGRNGGIVVHCFAGCTQVQVIDSLKTLGLWPEKEKDDEEFKPKYNPANDDRNLEAYDHAVMVIALAEYDKAQDANKEFTEPDIECIHKARRTISRYKQYFHFENLHAIEWRKLQNRRYEIAIRRINENKDIKQ